jgi:hypothetical protein
MLTVLCEEFGTFTVSQIHSPGGGGGRVGGVGGRLWNSFTVEFLALSSEIK